MNLSIWGVLVFSALFSICAVAETEIDTLLKQDESGHCLNPKMKRILHEAVSETKEKLKKLNIMSKEFKSDAPSAFGNVRKFLKTSKETLNIAKHEAVLEQIMHKLDKKFKGKMSKSEIRKALKNKAACVEEGEPLLRNPFIPSKCKHNRFRTLDGSCNNLRHPLWGRASTPFLRNLQPDYADGESVPRVAKNGRPLPSPRKISFKVVRDTQVFAPKATFMMVVYGQFLDHDMDLTPLATTSDSDNGDQMSPVKCGKNGCDDKLDDCFPIKIPKNDPVFGKFKCLEFVRSAGVPNAQNCFGKREQLNQITSYIDASNVYGSTTKDSNHLREDKHVYGEHVLGANLRMTPHPLDKSLKPLLPTVEHDEECRGTDGLIKCFVAGDVRVNEQNALTVLHTIWAREHNRIVEAFRQSGVNWPEEILFQTARSIVGAMMQHITYNEFLPLLLGKKVLRKHNALLLQDGFFKDYNPKVDASVSNAFATAAYRLGHTLLPSVVKRSDESYSPHSLPSLELSRLFFAPKEIYNTEDGGVDGFLRGMALQRSENLDEFMTPEVTNHLFAKNPPHGLGTDLASLNIQRGRDHGLPGYNAWRKWCGLTPLRSFSDLKSLFNNRKLAKRFKRIYRSVDDIDLFPAGIAEKPLRGGMAGETFACIIGDQFGRLRAGDRFWYENIPGPSRNGFTRVQLKEIRKTTLARVICSNSDNIHHIFPRVMEKAGPENTLVECDDIPRLNLAAWMCTCNLNV